MSRIPARGNRHPSPSRRETRTGPDPLGAGRGSARRLARLVFYGVVGSAQEPPKMSVFPNRGRQSCSGAGVATLAPVSSDIR